VAVKHQSSSSYTGAASKPMNISVPRQQDVYCTALTVKTVIISVKVLDVIVYKDSGDDVSRNPRKHSIKI